MRVSDVDSKEVQNGVYPGKSRQFLQLKRFTSSCSKDIFENISFIIFGFRWY